MSYSTVFTNGGSQAVRIPQALRFTTSRVSIESFRGGVLLMPVADKPTLSDVFAKCDSLTAKERKFLDKRPANGVPQARKQFKCSANATCSIRTPSAIWCRGSIRKCAAA